MWWRFWPVVLEESLAVFIYDGPYGNTVGGSKLGCFTHPLSYHHRHRAGSPRQSHQAYMLWSKAALEVSNPKGKIHSVTLSLGDEAKR